MKHSPEPWRIVGPTDRERKQDRPRWYVSRVPGCGDVPPEKFYVCILSCGDEERDKEDARRIVACVNACQHIPLDALEGGCLAALSVPE